MILKKKLKRSRRNFMPHNVGGFFAETRFTFAFFASTFDCVSWWGHKEIQSRVEYKKVAFQLKFLLCSLKITTSSNSN